MKVKYIGAFPAEQDTLVIYGKHVVRRDDPVAEIDDQFAAKVRGNRFFQVIEDKESPSSPVHKGAPREFEMGGVKWIDFPEPVTSETIVELPTAADSPPAPAPKRGRKRKDADK